MNALFAFSHGSGKQVRLLRKHNLTWSAPPAGIVRRDPTAGKLFLANIKFAEGGILYDIRLNL
jgi:hypothetical protein